MNDNNKEITEEALDILYSFEEPLEQHIRSKYSELNLWRRRRDSLTSAKGSPILIKKLNR